MNVRKLVLIIGITAFLRGLGFAAGGETGSRIYFRGTKDYVTAIQAAKINETDARDILRGAAKGRRGAYFYPEPLFFLNGEYLFGVPEKDRLPLTGYYVSGSDGRIVFRKSKFTLSAGEIRIPSNAFESEEQLEPDGPAKEVKP